MPNETLATRAMVRVKMLSGAVVMAGKQIRPTVYPASMAP